MITPIPTRYTEWTDVKVGSLVCAYLDGYHRVVAINPRKPNPSRNTDFKQNPLVDYKRVFNSDLSRPEYPNIVYTCDISFCKTITPDDIDNMRRKYNDGLLLLQTEIDNSDK